jgi:antitoxin VapB
MYQGVNVRQTAKVFMTGRSQAVRLPVEFRFEGKEVFISRDERTGDVILSPRPGSWGEIFAKLDGLEIPEDFLSAEERNQCEPEEREEL